MYDYTNLEHNDAIELAMRRLGILLDRQWREDELFEGDDELEYVVAVIHKLSTEDELVDLLSDAEAKASELEREEFELLVANGGSNVESRALERAARNLRWDAWSIKQALLLAFSTVVESME